MLIVDRCLPAQFQLAQGDFPHDFSKIPPEAFDVCTPTQGPTEVINVNAADGWVSINIISASSIDNLEVSIDEHPMWVYAVDGRHIEPVQVDVLQAANGNRYSVLVKLDKPVGDYTIRVPSFGLNQIVSGTATLSYAGSKKNNKSTPFIDYAGVGVTADVVAFVETKIVPFPPIAPAPTADVTYHLLIDRFGASYKWTLSGKESYGLELEEATPLLFDPNSAQAMNPNLTITTKMGQWVDLIVQVAGPLSPPHPLHKHSNKGFILGQGQGVFNWSTVAEAQKEIPQFFNFNNPPIKDGFTTLPAAGQPSWLVVRYEVVNPGAFLFHCHIQSHFALGGMNVAILDGIDKFPTVPEEYLKGNGFS
jgi:FtsP/CotA-like multicopper oxidase with cupredoxin domain